VQTVDRAVNNHAFHQESVEISDAGVKVLDSILEQKPKS